MSTAPESIEESRARLAEEHVEAVFAPFVRAALFALESTPNTIPPALRPSSDESAATR